MTRGHLSASERLPRSLGIAAMTLRCRETGARVKQQSEMQWSVQCMQTWTATSSPMALSPADQLPSSILLTYTCCEMERRTTSGFDSHQQPDVHGLAISFASPVVRKAGCLAQRASSTPTPAQVRDHSCSPLSVCLCVRPAVCT
eukprot:m.344199 g.344199  ORF g.344199 m.344199 type:complete len:144 (-) comp55788_c0_seq24:446-877(-)